MCQIHKLFLGDPIKSISFSYNALDRIIWLSPYHYWYFFVLKADPEANFSQLKWDLKLCPGSIWCLQWTGYNIIGTRIVKHNWLSPSVWKYRYCGYAKRATRTSGWKFSVLLIASWAWSQNWISPVFTQCTGSVSGSCDKICALSSGYIWAMINIMKHLWY